ncbi:unnamed protein product, partial [Ectocarpus fasciculatus]
STPLPPPPPAAALKKGRWEEGFSGLSPRWHRGRRLDRTRWKPSCRILSGVPSCLSRMGWLERSTAMETAPPALATWSLSRCRRPSAAALATATPGRMVARSPWPSRLPRWTARPRKGTWAWSGGSTTTARRAVRARGSCRPSLTGTATSSRGCWPIAARTTSGGLL